MNDELQTTTDANPLSNSADTGRLTATEQTLIEPASNVKERFLAPSPVPPPTASIEDSISMSELRYPVPEPVVGSQFGRYRIERELGRGGMGAVYRAFDTHLQRTVALKVPFFKKRHSEEIVKRFLREARAVAQLSHPNLCRVFDVGLIDGTLFLTMEFVEGQSLDELSKAGALTEAEILPLMQQVALALQEAHDRGIIHRDMKPANIMRNAKGHAVVMDFGLARQVDHEENELTKDGAMLGTPSYMSPEQVRGKVREIGPATDIYSLGVVMYRLLTGRCPFEGAFTAILAAIPTETPAAPRELCGTVSPAIEAICLKAMAKNPSDRFASAAEMAAALNQALQTPLGVDAGKLTEFNEETTRPISKSVASVALVQKIVAHPRKPAKSVQTIGCVITLSLAVVLLVAVSPSRFWSPVSGPSDATHHAAAVPPVTKSETANSGAPTEPAIEVTQVAPAVGTNIVAPKNPNEQLISANPVLETHLQRAQQQAGFEVLSPKSVPLHAQDKLQFHVTLTAPSYVYLYLIDTTGTPTRLWPETADGLDQQKKISELWAPPLAAEGQKQKMYFLDDLKGRETVLVATSQRPLSQSDLQSIESARVKLAPSAAGSPKLVSFRREEKERGIGGIVETDKTLPVEIDRFTEQLDRVFDGFTGIVFPHE